MKKPETADEHQGLLDLEQGQDGFSREIAASPGGDTLTLCFQCGVCTGTCPISEVDERFSPALIIQWIRLGLRSRVLGSPLIWYCLQCHRCSFHCPQGVRFADIDSALRERAVEEGFVTRRQAETVLALDLELRRLRRGLLDRLIIAGEDFDPVREATEVTSDWPRGEAPAEEPEREAASAPPAVDAPEEPPAEAEFEEIAGAPASGDVGEQADEAEDGEEPVWDDDTTKEVWTEGDFEDLWGESEQDALNKADDDASWWQGDDTDQVSSQSEGDDDEW